MNDVQKFEERSTLPAPQEQGSISLVQMAMQRGYDPEFISKMMDLQERNDAKIAKQAYVKAMSEFKANLPPVLKDKKNKQYDSMYASEAALMDVINPELSKYGLSASFSFPETEGNILKVTSTITHKDGHSESVTLPGPIDTSGSKNPLQQVKSTVTYLRKATIEAITGIATADPKADDDGNTSGQVEYINDQQYGSIIDMMNEADADEGKFLEYLKIESIEKMPLNKFNMAVKALEAKLAKK